MLRTLIAVLILAAALELPARAQTVEHPATVTFDGARLVPKAGETSRVHLLGVVELYSLAVYVDGSIRDRQHVVSPDVPKALRIAITYKDDLSRRITLDWRRELIPALEPAAIAQLRATFAALRYGDVVLIEYAPAKGTSIRINKAVAVAGIDHDLMLTFLDHWLGQRPVSAEIKRALVGSS